MVYARSLLLVVSLISLANGLEWTSPQTQPKTLQNLMVSIDERLDFLVNAKWESTLREMDQRLEAIESNFRRVDLTFQERLDKLERNLNSKELKDELMVEKLSHKMRDILDTSYDRYSRSLGYTEERLEMSLQKVQMSVEVILNRIEKQQEDIQTDVTETIAMMEDLKTNDDRLNSTHKAIHQQIQNLMTPNREYMQRISGSLEHISTRLNGSLGMWGSQNDGPQTGELFLSTIRSEISSESSKITSKMNNMYNEMWERVISVESILKDLGNTTRQEVLEVVRSLVPSDITVHSQENFIEVALDSLERKLQKLSRNIDDHMDTLIVRQDLIIDNCFESGLCQGLESRLLQVLEKIFEVLSDKIENSSNRTLNLDRLMTEMMELVKSQHSHLMRTVTHNTNMVVTLAEDSSDADKQLQYNITQLVDQYQELHMKLDTESNSRWELCTENTTTVLHKSEQSHHTNITEVKLIPLNITEPINVGKNPYDIGVLKITTDNFGTLADNTSLSSENTPQMVDNSIINIITTISPNITSDQIESMLRVLNSSVSFDNLEAIIQNTEAEPTTLDGGGFVLYDNEPHNTTNTKDNLVLIEGSVSSGQKEYISEDIEDVEDQDVTTDNITETIFVLNGSVFTDTQINGTKANKTEPTAVELSAEVKEKLQVYIFLWKIKNKYLNITLLTQQLEEADESDIETVKLLVVLQKLCHDETKLPDHVTRNRLLVSNEDFSNTDLYIVIEHICNRMAQSTHRQFINQDDIL